MKIAGFLLLPLLFFSCSKTNVNNGLKVSGNIKEKNIELPIINNIITDRAYEEPYELVVQNDIIPMGDWLRILLLPDSNIGSLKLTAANGRYKFTYQPEFYQIKNYFKNDDLGYYCDVFLENKSWISNGSDWTFSLFDNNNLIIEKTAPLLEIDNVLYKNIFKIKHSN